MNETTFECEMTCKPLGQYSFHIGVKSPRTGKTLYLVGDVHVQLVQTLVVAYEKADQFTNSMGATSRIAGPFMVSLTTAQLTEFKNAATSK